MQKIDWVETGSSGLTHISYKDAGEEVWVVFGSGNVYCFKSVPKRWYDELKKAKNPAQFVRRRLQQRFIMQRVRNVKPPIQENKDE